MWIIGATTLSITTLGIMTLITATLWIMTLIITQRIVMTFGVKKTQLNDAQHNSKMTVTGITITNLT